MARPKKERTERRENIAKCRLTAEEELTVKMNAAAAGLTVAEYTRRRVLGLTVTPPAARTDAALVSEVNRLGVNVNQIARAINSDREYKGDWEGVYDRLVQVVDRLTRL